jgi:hypothetical protein
MGEGSWTYTAPSNLTCWAKYQYRDVLEPFVSEQ